MRDAPGLMNVQGFGSAWPASRGPNIVTWGAPVYCALVVRNSFLVGGAKLTLRSEAAGARLSAATSSISGS
jgi:hypothetical protein